MLIFKIFLQDEWAKLASDGETRGAAIDIQDGYIHLSSATTVVETASKYFSNTDGLMILAIDSENCAPLKWEASRGGILFPHLYRNLKMTDVLWAKPLPSTPTGHLFPTGVL